MDAPATKQGPQETTAGDAWFKTTHWTVVLQAGHGDSLQAGAALGKLCQTYWFPIYAYVRRLGHCREDAQDLTQEFFARLISKDYLHSPDPQKGKFRSFLRVALNRFLANEWDKSNCQKRGGGQRIVSLDEPGAEDRYLAEFKDQNSPEKVLEQSWATALLEQALGQLAAEMQSQGKGQLFLELNAFLSAHNGRHTYGEVARRLDMSEGTLRVNIHRLRQRYRELLRLEIARTVDSPEAVDDEIRNLFAALS